MKIPPLLVSAAACGIFPWLAACVISVGGSSCSWASIQGSGVEASQTREVPAFSRVHLSGSADVIARIGGAQALSLRGDDNLLQYVETEVRGDTLHVGMAPGSYNFRRDLVVELSLPRLAGLAISGSGDASLDGVAGEALELSISGSGDVRAAGAVERLSVALSGSGDMDLAQLRAREANVQIAGSGDVSVDVSDKLSVSISGSGDVRYSGHPQITTQISGSGSVSGS